MAAIVFTIRADAKEAHEAIEKLKKSLESIKSVKINPGITEKELAALTKLTSEQAKLVSANARLVAANNKLKISENELKIAREKTKQVTKEQEEATKRATEATNRAKEATKQAKEETKQATEVTKKATEATKQKNAEVRKAKEVTKQQEEATKRATEATNKAKEATKQAKEETKQAAEATKRSADATQRAAEKTAQAHEKTLQTLSKERAEATKNETAQAKLAAQREKNADAASKHAAATDTESNALKGAIDALNNFHDQLMENPFFANLASTLRSRISTAIIGGVTSATSQAIETMKSVDTELTNIRKVSPNMTDEEIKRIGDSAYSAASEFGVAADEYLSAVYEFQKAGLSDSAEDMAKLATKTMLVGDTTATAASKFLIAANAAWNYQGDIEKLSAAVDEADYINNNYATTLEKISAGMPIVASTAANMGMSLEETMAVLGTITAVTQESGTKAATAWRALSMNLAGEIGTFLTEDGDEIEVTAESIESVTDALKKYAPEAVEAAKATGKMIDPIKAVESLARAYKEGQLNDIELTNILMGVGGKLRTNQLTALVKNFDMYEKMLGELSTAAGTADAELSTMLDSWERKTQILKNTWTEFISGLINTDYIKTAIDGLIGLVDGLSTGIGKAVAIVGGLGAAFLALGPTLSIIVAGVGIILEIIHKVKESTKVYEENTKALHNMEKAYADADKKLRDTQVEIQATGNLTKDYIEKLKGLDKGTEEYHDTLERICELMPDLREYIDLENDSISGGIESLEARADAWIKEAEAAAYATAISAKAQAVAAAELEAKKTEIKIGTANEEKEKIDEKIRLAQEEYQNLYDLGSFVNVLGDQIFDENLLSDDDRERLYELGDALTSLYDEQASKQSEIDQLTQAWEEQKETIAAATKELELEQEAYEELNKISAPEGQNLSRQGLPEQWQTGGGPSKEKLSKVEENIARLTGKTAENTEEIAQNTEEIEENLGEAADNAERLDDSLPNASTPRENVGKDLEHFYESIDVTQEGVSVAEAIADGIAQGTDNNSGIVVGAAEKLANELIQATKDELGIASPSKVMEEVGENIVAGLAVGIQSEASSQIGTAGSAGATMGRAIGDGIISQSGYIKEKIAQTFTIAKQFIDGLAANASMSYHPTGAAGYYDRTNTWHGFGNAAGTTNSPGGETLVNELGPELINDNGRVYIANGGKPAVVNLSRGSIVLTAEQTAEALRTASTVPSQGAALGFNLNTAINMTDTGTGGEGEKYQAYVRAVAQGNGSNTVSGSRVGKGGGGGSAAAAETAQAVDDGTSALQSQLDDILKKIELQVKLAENEGDYPRVVELYEQAQEEIAKMVDAYRKAGYADDSPEILELLNQNYEYANKQLKVYQDKFDELVDALEAQTDATKLANQLAEKQQAVEDAREALANAQKQRTVRIYNAATGQWEWIADDEKTQKAQETLAKAEESYADEVKSQAIKELQSMRDTISDMNDIVLGPALSAVATMAQSSPEFQAFAQALNAVFGVGSYLTGTEGSTKVIPTTDSHDTVYSFGDVVLTEEQASTMTLKQLAQQLQVLKIS